MNALPKTHQPLVSQQNHYLIDGLKINRTCQISNIGELGDCYHLLFILGNFF